MCVCFISDYSPGAGVVIQKGPHKDMCGKVSIVCENNNFIIIGLEFLTYTEKQWMQHSKLVENFVAALKIRWNLQRFAKSSQPKKIQKVQLKAMRQAIRALQPPCRLGKLEKTA